MKVMPYGTPMQMRLFHREEDNLRALSPRNTNGHRRPEPYAPTFHATFVDPEGTPNRQAKLVMG